MLKYLIWIIVFIGFASSEDNTKTDINIWEKNPTTADHSKYPILQKTFNSPEEVIEACIHCHVEAAKQVQKTIHWKWVCPKDPEGKVGKAKIVNNFCISVISNEPRCTSCHAGYGWEDKDYDFTAENKVDCLVCHDQTGTYEKFPSSAGYPVIETKFFDNKTYNPPDYNFIAQNVSWPTRENCGVCHFYGGGGDNIKHGDLSSALIESNHSLDVHMDSEGLNFACSTCHTTEEHKISGRCYTVPHSTSREVALPANRENLIACESCHSARPHKINNKLNDHTDKVACQTCHIPIYAKEVPTKMWWDWSKAGRKDKNGNPIILKDENGNVTYMSKKGEFRWAKNVVPEYYWFNGIISHTLLEEEIDPHNPVHINYLHGDYDNPNSQIWPFKVHRGKQPFDPINNKLVVPNVYGLKGSGAYWSDYDWDVSIKKGMDYYGGDYSGNYAFVETEMYWIISHEISPKEEALSCEECHSSNGRLQELSGFYMPGRDNNFYIEFIGWITIIVSIIVVINHAGFRWFSNKMRNNKDA